MRFSREMGITHADFYRLLPAAVDNRSYTRLADGVEIELDTGKITIELGAEGARRIASLTLPMTEVRFAFAGVPEPQVDAFMARFELYFRRGGG